MVAACSSAIAAIKASMVVTVNSTRIGVCAEHVSRAQYRIHIVSDCFRGSEMRTAGSRVSYKHFQLDNAKIRLAQNILCTKAETETIERALGAVVDGHRRSRLAAQAHEPFLKSGIEFKDVYGKLA